MGFFNHIYIKCVALKFEGPNQDIFGDLHFDLDLPHVHQRLSNLFGKVMHSRDLVQWAKTSLSLDMLAELYMGCKVEKSHVVIFAHWVAHGTTSQNN